MKLTLLLPFFFLSPTQKFSSLLPLWLPALPLPETSMRPLSAVTQTLMLLHTATDTRHPTRLLPMRREPWRMLELITKPWKLLENSRTFHLKVTFFFSFLIFYKGILMLCFFIRYPSQGHIPCRRNRIPPRLLSLARRTRHPRIHCPCHQVVARCWGQAKVNSFDWLKKLLHSHWITLDEIALSYTHTHSPKFFQHFLIFSPLTAKKVQWDLKKKENVNN